MKKQHTFKEASSIAQRSTICTPEGGSGPSRPYVQISPQRLRMNPTQLHSLTAPVARSHVLEGWTTGLGLATHLLYEDAPTSFPTCPMADRLLEKAQRGRVRLRTRCLSFVLLMVLQRCNSYSK